jgi:subtilase family serine protease
MRSIKASPLGVLAGVLLCSTATLLAQGSMISPRITAEVNESSRTTLRGNVPHLARAQYDQGAAEAATQLTHMRLVLSRSAEQQAALEQYLAQLQDKSSPNYHKWLTPQQFGQLYGPADSDISALVAWLQSQGLTLETVSAGRTNIAFSGSVSQVEEAFHTPIHSFRANGIQFYSNTADPQIPSALATVVKGVAHLNTIRPRPQLIRGNTGTFNPQTKRLEAASTRSASGPRSSLTAGSGTTSSPYFLYMVPGDAATIYDTPNFLNANNSSGTAYTGAGVKIGVGGDATIQASIVGLYRSTFLGSSYGTLPTVYYCTTSISCSSTAGSGYVASDAGEAYLDNELSGSMAPGAAIYYYASSDLTTGIEAAIDANVVDIFSLSFGLCELDMSTSDNLQIKNWWQQAAAQGIAVTVSSGDSGSAGCDATTDSNGKSVTAAVGGLQVNGMASTPYNIAVGGTDFYPLETSFSPYASTSPGSSSTYYRTALEYIPESSWNDSVQNDSLQISANVPWSIASGNANIAASSGGASNCSTNTTSDSSPTVGSCTQGYSKPSWQTGAGVPADGARDLPDVSLMAGDGMDNAAWLVCDESTTTNSSNQTVTSNCLRQSDGYFYFDAYGGTSASVQAFAGILALVQQKTGSRLGQAAPVLYNLFNGGNSNSIFHDVTLGNNSVPCTSGTPNCTHNTGGYYFESGYNAGTGYDLATGLGSVDATKLVNYWSTANGTATATVAVNPPSSSITALQSLSLTVTVTGSSTAPTGTVTLSGGGYTSAAELPQSTSSLVATYTFTILAGGLSSGTDTLTAIYNGDASDKNYGIATGTATATVSGGVSGATYTLAATTPAAIAPGATATSTVTVSSSTGYAGTVALTCALTLGPSGASYTPTCQVNPATVTLSSGTTSGTATVTVSTTAATSELLYPKLPGRNNGLFGAGGGAVLALLVFLGIPARRRSWRSMLGVLVLMAALGSLSACGINGGGGTVTPSTPGTSTGTYIFTVTGAGNPTVSPAPTAAMFTVTVN